MYKVIKKETFHSKDLNVSYTESLRKTNSNLKKIGKLIPLTLEQIQ